MDKKRDTTGTLQNITLAPNDKENTLGWIHLEIEWNGYTKVYQVIKTNKQPNKH